MSHFINSEAIFEAIGDYPVVDQFDLLYANLQSGSYVDNYISGSMLVIIKSEISGTMIASNETRRLIFSKLSPNNTTPPLPRQMDTNRSYNLQPFKERAGIIRNVRIFSNVERFYDSLLPDLSSLIKAYGGKIVYLGGANNLVQLSLGNYGSTTISGFLETFPFEPMFSSVKRSVLLDTFLGEYAEAPIKQFNSSNLKILFSDGIRAWNDFISTSVHATSRENTDAEKAAGKSYQGLHRQDISKIVFGYGDWNSRTGYSADSTTGYTHYPYFRSGSIGIGVPSFVIGPVIRGWKYGLHDGNPHYTSCTFRRDHFGQYRDMLEQRLYPVIYLDTKNAPCNIAAGFEAPAMPPLAVNVDPAIDYPVKVVFVKQQIITIGVTPNEIELLVSSEQQDPTQTWSSNMSSYATSSLPFFDLEGDQVGRNRGAIPDSVLNLEELVL